MQDLHFLYIGLVLFTQDRHFLHAGLVYIFHAGPTFPIRRIGVYHAGPTFPMQDWCISRRTYISYIIYAGLVYNIIIHAGSTVGLV